MTKYKGSDPNLKPEIADPRTAEEIQTPVEKISALSTLRIPNYRLLLTGTLLANASQWIRQIILSWLIYDLTGSGTILGSIDLVSSAASFCMLLAAGLLVDYFNRRKLLMAGNGLMFIVTLALGFVLLTGHSNLIYLFAFAVIVGFITTLDSTARQVILFDTVPRSQSPVAMALLQTVWSLMRVLGPSLGGFLILWFGGGGSFLVLAGAYMLILITVAQLKLPLRKKGVAWSSPLKNFREGISYLIKERITRIFTLIGIVMPILIIPVFNILPPIYAVKVFGDESGRILGFLMASVGVGGIIGGVATTYLRRIEHWGRLQLVSLFLTSSALIGFAFSSMLAAALAFLALAGFFEVIFLTTNQTLIQLSISDALRGRVTAIINLTWILSPIGSLLAGAGADLTGGPKLITIILAGTAMIVIVILFLLSPTVRNYRLSQGMKSD
jgi:MFS family permease